MPARYAFAALAAACLLIGGVPAAGATAQPTIEDPIVVESFDGTPIVATLMLPEGASKASPVPVILQTHGWGGTREQAPGGLSERLLDHGYAVFTWDARGFGDSGGEANIDSVDFEVKDTKILIDYLGDRPEIQKDGVGDPRLGWVGGSYAGGIQLNTAAFDKRVDAIVPEIAWADLIDALYPGGVIKRTWDELLYFAGVATAAANGLDSPAGPQTGIYAQEIHEAEVLGTATGEFPEDLQKWFAERSTILNTPRITAPTMLVQGTIDTLFPLEAAFDHYRVLKRNGVPVKLLAYCSGHAIPGCSYPGGASGDPDGERRTPLFQDRIVAWLDRYVMNSNVNTGPEIEWQAQDGFYYSGPQLPLPGTRVTRGKAVEATLVGPGSSGGDEAARGGPAPAFELGSTAARAEILPAAEGQRSIVGVPRLKLTGTVTGLGAVMFFELVDVAPDGSRRVVDEQTMPLRVGGGEIDQKVDLHGVAWLLEPGHSIELEITTGSTQYDLHRMGPYAVSIKAMPRLPVAGAPGRPSR